MNKTKKKHILTAVICDALALALSLSLFSYFHHVKKMTSSDNSTIQTPNSSHFGTSQNNNSGTASDKETDSADSAAADNSGFAANFPEGTFLPEGEVDRGDGYYKSHDINLTVTEVFEKINNDYYAKYFVYDVYVRNIENLFTVYSESRTPFRTLVAAADPIAAVSGDFFGGSAKVAVRNGKVLVEEDSIENDICVLYRTGEMEIVSPSEYSEDYFVGRDVYQIWDFGPNLLKDNGAAYGEGDFNDYSDITPRNPRSSIGYFEPGHYVFIVVEGRLDVMHEGELVYCKGVRMWDLAEIYEKLGTKLAYNLDGGDSAFAYYDGEVIREDYERATEADKEPREIYDIICIAETAKGGN